MKTFTVQLALLSLFLVISGTSAMFWDDLRVTSGTNLTIHFQRLPRTAYEATTQNWVSEGTFEDCDKGPFRGVRYTEPNDDSIALLFDKNGVVAGIQAQIPHSEILGPLNTFRFERVPMFQNITIRGEEFFVLTAYFVNPTTICSTGRNESDLLIGGTGTGLWYQNGPNPNYLIEVSHDRAEGWAKGWSKNKCWRGMGTHNFWKTEEYENHSCNEIRPAFNLFDEKSDELLGFGFTIPGGVDVGRLKRFERPQNAQIGGIISPAPACLTAMNDRIGATTLHVYFTDAPWTITCAEQ